MGTPDEKRVRLFKTHEILFWFLYFINTPTHSVAIEFGDYYRSAMRLTKERY